jgi:hypothetical protein
LGKGVSGRSPASVNTSPPPGWVRYRFGSNLPPAGNGSINVLPWKPVNRRSVGPPPAICDLGVAAMPRLHRSVRKWLGPRRRPLVHLGVDAPIDGRPSLTCLTGLIHPLIKSESALPFDGPPVTRYCHRAVTLWAYSGSRLYSRLAGRRLSLGRPSERWDRRPKPDRFIANRFGAEGVCG